MPRLQPNWDFREIPQRIALTIACAGRRARRSRGAGTVEWFNDSKGFGFITPDDGDEDLLAHVSAINMDGFKTLEDGQMVQSDFTQGPKGKQASTIEAG